MYDICHIIKISPLRDPKVYLCHHTIEKMDQLIVLITTSSFLTFPDVIKRRQKQNLTNIYMTFWAWLAQFLTNIILVLAVRIFYGQNQFVYQLLGLLTIFFNFNVLPFVYIILANEKFKKAFVDKKCGSLLKLFFSFRN